MDTTATNKRIRELVGDLEAKRLIPNPKFQRRLVWSQKHKADFIQTILEGLPFPEIYIAAGDVDVDTGHGHSMLVDGQQRMTTIFEYFKGSLNLKLPPSVPNYIQLKDAEKREFLEYKVVVRDLGPLPQERVVEIFQRINSTSYSLNAIEIANARYDNDLKDLAEDVSVNPFWDRHTVFKINEVKRMLDVNFILILVTTMMSDYYNRDDRVEEFLKRYNDGFADQAVFRKQVESTLGLVDDFNLAPSNRAWQRADLFTLLVETHRLSFKQNAKLNPSVAGKALQAFYERVDAVKNRHHPQARLEIATDLELPVSDQDLVAYYRATLQGSNDRKSRIQRGMILSKILILAAVK